jgi:UDP-N-acetylmuramoyl-tripeptide--D-alanyl-D-alanine ligase
VRFLAPDRSPRLFAAYVGALRTAARVWRSLLGRTTFVAITGSLGKTIAKDCLAEILAARAPTGKTFASQSAGHGVPLSILRIRPWHRYAVLETGAPGKRMMGFTVPAVRPRVAVVLTVLQNHSDHFRDLAEIAAAKAELVAGLPPDGIAVLNADVPLVLEMARRAPGRVVTFGTSPGSDLRVEDVHARWPERLRFRAVWSARAVDVRTRLVGEHLWVPAAGALAAAAALGVPLAEAAAALSRVAPPLARLQPVALPGGAVLLRDELGAVPASFDAALRVLREAEGCRRRVAVLGRLSDSRMRGGEGADRIGREAAGAADAVVFVGRYAKRSANAAVAAGLPREHVHAFERLENAAAFLRTELKAGDLVLLKGRVTEHLARLYHALLGSVACHDAHCRLTLLCDHCSALGFRARRDASAGAHAVVETGR